MNTPTRQIPPERKAIYYGGMALIAVGLLLFVSNFFAGPEIGGRNRPQPGQPDFWERAQEQHEEFGRGMKASMVRATLSQIATFVLDSLSVSWSGVNLSSSHHGKSGGHDMPSRS